MEANLSYSSLKGSDLSDSNLIKSNLNFAELSSTTNLKGTNLCFARLNGLKLSEQSTNKITDSNTRFIPEKFDNAFSGFRQSINNYLDKLNTAERKKSLSEIKSIQDAFNGIEKDVLDLFLDGIGSKQRSALSKILMYDTTQSSLETDKLKKISKFMKTHIPQLFSASQTLMADPQYFTESANSSLVYSKPDPNKIPNFQISGDATIKPAKLDNLSNLTPLINYANPVAGPLVLDFKQISKSAQAGLTTEISGKYPDDTTFQAKKTA